MGVVKPEIGSFVAVTRVPLTTVSQNNRAPKLMPVLVTDVYDDGRIDGIEFRARPFQFGSRDHAKAVLDIMPGNGVGEWKHFSSINDQKDVSIVDAIAQLDANDPSVWTGQGKPQVDALEKILGRDITAKDRDDAWDSFQERTSNDS